MKTFDCSGNFSDIMKRWKGLSKTEQSEYDDVTQAFLCPYCETGIIDKVNRYESIDSYKTEEFFCCCGCQKSNPSQFGIAAKIPRELYNKHPDAGGSWNNTPYEKILSAQEKAKKKSDDISAARNRLLELTQQRKESESELRELKKEIDFLFQEEKNELINEIENYRKELNHCKKLFFVKFRRKKKLEYLLRDKEALLSRKYSDTKAYRNSDYNFLRNMSWDYKENYYNSHKLSKLLNEQSFVESELFQCNNSISRLLKIAHSLK